MRAFYLGLLLLVLGSCQRLGAPATPGEATENRRDNRPASPDFTLLTNTGEAFTLRSLRGSYVLLDFRTADCGECAAENTNLRKIYGQFNHRGLVIVSVWLGADQAAGLPVADSLRAARWFQVLDSQGLQGTTAKNYEVKQLPTTVLLDPRGYELARNLRGRELGQEISVHIPLD